jgi:hypothetical protein
VTKQSKQVWFRPSQDHRPGSISFGLCWLSLFLLPVIMIAAALVLVAVIIVVRQLWLGALAVEVSWGPRPTEPDRAQLAQRQLAGDDGSREVARAHEVGVDGLGG